MIVIVIVFDGVICYFIMLIVFLCDLIYLVWKRIFGEGKEKFIVRKDNMYFEEGYIKIIG